MTTVFFSYSHVDEDLRDMLEKHLSALKHQGMIDTWHDRCIRAGDEFSSETSDKLESASIILLLVSADFIASSYCYDVEMKRALERHHSGEARVIPVILRACDWRDTPFGTLLATPKDGRPVRSWPDLDDAFLDVVRTLKAAVQETRGHRTQFQQRANPADREMALTGPVPTDIVAHPRSSNLRLRKQFSEADKDSFRDKAFEFMANYFESSLSELEARNGDVTTRFRRIDQNRFTATVYHEGTSVARCSITLGGMLGNGITYSASDQIHENSFNESLSVENDDQAMFLTVMGMGAFGNQVGSHLTPEGAAEYYWSMLMQPLQ